jgi:hypothetical protein
MERRRSFGRDDNQRCSRICGERMIGTSLFDGVSSNRYDSLQDSSRGVSPGSNATQR